MFAKTTLNFNMSENDDLPIGCRIKTMRRNGRYQGYNFIYKIHINQKKEVVYSCYLLLFSRFLQYINSFRFLFFSWFLVNMLNKIRIGTITQSEIQGNI